MAVHVGDILFRKERIAGLDKVTVTKITPTGNIRVSDGSLLTADLHKKTSDTWSTVAYYPWSQELEDAYCTQQLQNRLALKLSALDVYKLEKGAVKILLDALDTLDTQSK